MNRGKFRRRDRLVQEKRHDTYKEWEKWPEPTVCKLCSAVFTGGRWTWNQPPENAHYTICPACQRIKDKMPAGIIDIKGNFWKHHRDEILNLINNEAKLQKQAHPMERIMELEEGEDKIYITTTGVHIARRIGEALYRAYQGEFDFTYGDEEKSIRVFWKR